MTQSTSDILTPEQAATYLQVNRETIYRYIRDGRLSASRLGRSYRITRRSLDQLMLSTRTRPDIPVRLYTDDQLAAFLVADRLDDPTLDRLRALKTRQAVGSSLESH